MDAKIFVQKFGELRRKMPRIALLSSNSENSEYTNFAYKNKNCYLAFGSHYNEDSFYLQYCWKMKDCVDCDTLSQSELCYECVYGTNLYNCAYLFNCFSSSDCSFGFDLVNCRNCFLCAGLRNVEYHILNKPVSRERYQEEVRRLREGRSWRDFFVELETLRKTVPHRAVLQKNCEDSEGSYLENCKNCISCFNAMNAEDSLYMGTKIDAVKDCMDCDCIGYDPSELLYECIGNSGNFNCNFCYSCWHNSDLEYCEHVFNSHHCFGCISRTHAAYEILNEKYSETDYFQKVAEIKAALRKAGLYGKWLLPSTYPVEDTIRLVGQTRVP